MSNQRTIFIDRNDITIMENIALGMCLIASYFQGVNAQRGERELRQSISLAIDAMVDYLSIADDDDDAVLVCEYPIKFLRSLIHCLLIRRKSVLRESKP